MSLEEIASAAGMDADRTRRIMKLLASQRCFFEPHEGMFEHTALSAFIAQENDIRAAMAFQYVFFQSPYQSIAFEVL